MDDYERGLLAGLLIGEGTFVVYGNKRLPVVSIRLHTRHSRFLHEMRDRLGLGQMYGPYFSKDGRRAVVWHIRRHDELMKLCDLLDGDRFIERCDWIAYRYGRLRTRVRAIALRRGLRDPG